jgi:Mg-chelatase subunit ChlD
LTLAGLALWVSACAGAAAPNPGLPMTSVPQIVYATPIPTQAPQPSATAALPVQQQPAQPEVRAGEVDDNQQWDEYLAYRQAYRGPGIHDVDISERYRIQALDGAGRPLLDAEVTIWDGQRQIWQGRTYADGQAMLFPRALQGVQSETLKVSVHKNGQAYTFDLQRGAAELWTARLEHLFQSQGAIDLDLLFLLDATGSMDDEIAALQSSMLSIAAQIDRMRPRPNLRFGLVSYRDLGDEYVVRRVPFTANVGAFSNQLAAISASGGGDYPESLNEALHVALHEMDWRDQDTLRLVFLVADAPPHLDYLQDYDYAQEMAVAAANGVKIFPIAASGSDDQAEYIFRQLAQFTMGRYLFLTYENPSASGGSSGDASSMHVSGYGVQDLDDLVLMLVEDELAHQRWQQ